MTSAKSLILVVRRTGFSIETELDNYLFTVS